MLIKLKKNKTLQCFLLCALLGLISIGFYIIQGHGFFIVREDFNEQQIPFTVGLHQCLLDGGISGWNWSQDLGTSTLQGYSFYELGSPFFWISMLFPAKAFPYLVGWIYILKYALAGTFAFLWLRRHLKQVNYAIFAAVLYAFSGFQTTNLIYYHFHDVVALFPLILLGLDILLEKGDIRLFAFAIAINCLLNYFFFIAEAIFAIFYFIFVTILAGKNDETLPGPKADTLGLSRSYFANWIKSVGKCIAGGILGVGMASVLFIPSVIYIMNNSRASVGNSGFSLFHDWRFLLYVIKGFLMPGESMPDLSCVYPSKFYSVNAYLPMVGFILVIAYIIKKRDWLSRFLIFLTVCAFIPALGNVFYLFTDNQMRWLYMFVLMMALATARVLEEICDYKAGILRISCLISFIALMVFTILIVFVIKDESGQSLLYSTKRFIIYMGFSWAGCFATSLFMWFKDKPFVKKHFYKGFLTAICIFAVLTTMATLHVYRSNGRPVDPYAAQYEMACDLTLPDGQYRLNDASNVNTMVSHVSGFSLFTSTDASSITEFEDLFDYYGPTYGLNKNTYPGLSQLMGGKYVLGFEPYAPVVATYEHRGVTYYLMEQEACPIGYGVSHYIRESELRSLAVENRAIALLQAVCVADDVDESLLTGLSQMKASDIVLSEDSASLVSQLVQENTALKVNDFTKDGHGMSCTTSYDNDTWIYFSVPYDEGWRAYVDGQETEIVYTGAMMMIKVPSGDHSVTFTYKTPYYSLGLAVSVVSLLIFVGVCFWYWRRKANG